MPVARDGDHGRGTVDLTGGHSIAGTGQPERKSRLNSSIPGGTRVDEEKPTEGIMALHTIRRKSAAAAAGIGLSALIVAGCARDPALGGVQLSAAAAGAPVAVACEPQQRAIVRQVVVNGALQSQVQCESMVAPAGTTGSFPPSPLRGYGEAGGVASPVAYAQPVAYAPIDNTRLVRTAYPQQVVTREAAPQVVRYQRAPERVVVRQPKRSVKKSAIIIGSSAGVGAGIGAAVGGKKGAGIGALVGGGGAALWDQITRRR
jgi:hypothetical protein